MNVTVKVNKHADKIAKLLLGIDCVQPIEASKMKQRAVKYACSEIDALEKKNDELVEAYTRLLKATVEKAEQALKGSNGQ